MNSAIRDESPADSTPANGRPVWLRPPLEGGYAVLVRNVAFGGSRVEGRGRAVGVTSCRPGEGVSTVAANLAVEAAGPGARRTLLIDANSEDPAVARAFGLEDSPGLAELLAGEAEPEQCIRPSPLERLWILSAGRAGERAGFDLFEAESRLGELRRKFDFLVMDLPPAVERTFCFAWAGMLDGVLLVIEAGRVSAEAAARAKDRLGRSGAKLLGAVLNKTDEES